MMYMLWIFWVLSFASAVKSSVVYSQNNSVNSSQPQNSELLAVVVVHRHGDRSPLVSFPNDHYNSEKYWPMGYAQLTPQGIRRSYALGKWMRQHYGHFLNEIYSPKEIYVYSTNTDRTISTAMAVMSGLYPPKGFQDWSADLKWQPIPVHTYSRVTDEFVTEKRPCPKYTREFDKMVQARTNLMRKKYGTLLQYVSKNSGWTNVTVNEILTLRNQFYVFQQYNESFIPEWAKSIYPDTELDFIANSAYKIQTWTPTLARLRTGPFFHQIFRFFDNFTCHCPDREKYKLPKFLHISCHDTCITTALDAMKSYDMRNIEFTDTLIWELRKSKGCKFFVNLLYKHIDKYDEELEQLNIHNCDFDCDYREFKSIMKQVTVDLEDWEKECYERS